MAHQALELGLVDEVQLHLVPVIVGAGTPLFAPGSGGWRLTPIPVVEVTASAAAAVSPRPGRAELIRSLVDEPQMTVGT